MPDQPTHLASARRTEPPLTARQVFNFHSDGRVCSSSIFAPASLTMPRVNAFAVRPSPPASKTTWYRPNCEQPAPCDCELLCGDDAAEYFDAQGTDHGRWQRPNYGHNLTASESSHEGQPVCVAAASMRYMNLVDSWTDLIVQRRIMSGRRSALSLPTGAGYTGVIFVRQ